MAAKPMALETQEVEGTDHRGTCSSAPFCKGPLVPHQRALLTLLAQNQDRQKAAFTHRVANALKSAAEAVSQLSSPVLGHFASALLQGICDLWGQLKLLLATASFSSHSERALQSMSLFCSSAWEGVRDSLYGGTFSLWFH